MIFRVRFFPAAAKLLCGLVLLAGWWPSLGAEVKQNETILFLRLKITNDVVSLVKATVQPGHLKVPIAPEKQGELFLELLSTNHVPLWTDVMPDPRVRHHDYEDPAHPGQLTGKAVKLDQAEITVRVPGGKGAKQIGRAH